MRLVITGTPGCGKTTLAKKLGEKLGFRVINEKDFALKNHIGAFNDENELEIPIKKFEKKANAFLAKSKKVIFEGHVLCEMKLKADKVLLLKINPEELEGRLEQRGYAPQKIMDNVFCEGIDYCKKHVLRNYPKSKVVEVLSAPSAAQTLAHALKALQA